MTLQNKSETVSLNTKDKKSRGYISYDLSRTDNISNNASNVNNNETKFSLDIDSDGNKLTQQQAEYFKNSKVRDEGGNLLKVYHGTTENFTVFDKTKGRSNMDIQGMFFSPWEIDAKGYGSNVNAYYINITNPASERMGYMALRKFQGQNNAGVKAREYLESLGYDGVNNSDEEYIAFNSNQIKLADNLTPTENEDIRFSRDVNIDEFDDTKYNEIKLGKKEYAVVSSAITTRYANKYSNELRSINYGDYKYRFVYNENGITYYSRYNIEDYLKGLDDYGVHGKAKNDNRLSGLLETSERYNSRSLSSNGNGRTTGNIDSFNRKTLQAERQSDGFGYRKNADNDKTFEEKYSRDVDYAEYAELKRENKYLKEVQSIDVLYAENAKKEPAGSLSPEVSTPPTGSTISISNLLDYVNIILL